MAPVPIIPPFNMDFHPRPSVMNSSHTTTKPSTITPRHVPNNIVSHAVYLQDTETLDSSYKRILESPTHHLIHLRSIADTQTTTPVHGEGGLQTEMSPAIIITITVVILVVLFLSIFSCDKYLGYREKMKMKKKQEEERNDADGKERIQEGQFMEIDLGELGDAVVEHVEYADVESGKEVAKKGRRSGSGWMRFWR